MISLRFAVMLLLAPIGVTTAIVRPIWGLYWLVTFYYFRPDVWDQPTWFQPVMWTSVGCIVGWLLQLKDIRITPPIILAVILILGMVLTSFTARVDSDISFECTVVIIKLVTVMFLIVQLIRDLKTLWTFLWMNVIANLWTLKAVLVLTVGGGDASRVDVSSGQGGGANYLAMLFVMALPLFYFRYMHGVRWEKRLAVILTPLYILGMIGTGSRGGFLTIFVIMIYLGIRSKKLLQGFAGMLVVGILLAIFTPQEKWDRFMTTFAETGQERGFAANSRLYLWEAAWKMFTESPVVGVGHDNFAKLSPRYTGFFAGDTPTPYNAGLEQTKGYKGFVAHSTWFQALAEGGLIGAAPFFAILIHMFYTLSRVRRVRLRGPIKVEIDIASRTLEGIMLAFVVASCFGSHFKIDFLWWYVGVVSALGLIADEARNREARVARLQRMTQIQSQPGHDAHPAPSMS
jgi:O-antigen ligase